MQCSLSQDARSATPAIAVSIKLKTFCSRSQLHHLDYSCNDEWTKKKAEGPNPLLAPFVSLSCLKAALRHTKRLHKQAKNKIFCIHLLDLHWVVKWSATLRICATNGLISSSACAKLEGEDYMWCCGFYGAHTGCGGLFKNLRTCFVWQRKKGSSGTSAKNEANSNWVVANSSFA